jgi:16S rRNA (uracil1498-N3)-methyltransferase
MIIFKSDISSLTFTKTDEHVKVIRPKVGLKLKLTDLKGSIYHVEVTSYDFKKSIGTYKILEEKKIDRPKSKILIQSIIDKSYIEKLIEIIPLVGITNLILVESDYSPKTKINFERLNLILLRACEQTENPHPPIIETTVLSLKNYIYTNSLRPTILELPTKNQQTQNNKTNTIVVGPEGGFSEVETQLFKELKLQYFSLNTNVLPAWIAGYSYFI